MRYRTSIPPVAYPIAAIVTVLGVLVALPTHARHSGITVSGVVRDCGIAWSVDAVAVTSEAGTVTGTLFPDHITAGGDCIQRFAVSPVNHAERYTIDVGPYETTVPFSEAGDVVIDPRGQVGLGARGGQS